MDRMSTKTIVMFLVVIQCSLLITFAGYTYENIETIGDALAISMNVVVALLFIVLTATTLLLIQRRGLRRFSELAKMLNNGNFSFVEENSIENTNDEAKLTYRQFSLSISHFVEIVLQVRDGVMKSEAASYKIIEAGEVLSDIVAKQRENNAVVSTSIEDMVYTIVSNAAVNAQAAYCSKQSEETAKAGGDVVLKTISKIQCISDVVDKSVHRIEQLNQSCEDIGDMVAMIGNIASQTNLLALNAAIEAARAGEQGRGFAVVADEVRSLANNTTNATRRIEDVVTTIQNGVVETALVMKQANVEVSAGIALADEAGRSLDAIVIETREVLNMIRDIASSSDESADSSTDKTAYHLDRVSTTANESANYVEEAAEKVSDLKSGIDAWRDVSGTLPSLLAKLKIR